MKISDIVPASTFFMPSSLLATKNQPMKPFKFNRRLKNRMSTLSKSLASMAMPVDNYQIIPASSVWTHTQLTPSNPLIKLVNKNHTSVDTLHSSVSPPLCNQQKSQQNTPMDPTCKSFTMPRITTTFIPLNMCPSEYSQTVKPIPLPSVSILDNHDEQNTFERKSNATVSTHLIGDWIIRESSKPFQRQENEWSTPIEHVVQQEKNVIANKESTLPQLSRSFNVNQWTMDNVCSFFETVLGKNTYSSTIKEHLIDGTALLLLQDEHLSDIFKMQLGPRLKLLNRINQLKNGDFSGL